MDDYPELFNRVIKRMDSRKFDNSGNPVKKEGFKSEIAGLIDHTLLKPEATPEEIAELCRQGDEFGFASICVNSGWISLCQQLKTNPAVKICGISGFPLGANSARAKAAEAASCVEDGAIEVDMVMNIGQAKSGNWDYVVRDISEVVKTVANAAIIKVIIECCLLTDEEKVKACICAREAGAAFVKTSTGFNKWGAKAPDVALMRRVVGDKMGIKAAGGIRTLSELREIVEAGADRIGTSTGVAIIHEEMEEKLHPLP